MNCNKLVDLLGGLNQIELLWLGNLNEEKFQFALINNTGRNTKKIFYLCENSLNKEIISDQTLEVLSNRNLLKIYYNSSDLFADIFSLTSKESRNYIMSTLNLQSFNITKNEMNQAYIAGLMKINQKTNKVVIKKQPEKDTTTTEVVNVTKPKEEKFVPKKSSDKTPPTIIIAKSMTVNNYSYILKGKVKDTGSKNLYIEIDGMIQQANNGDFSFKRFSPIDEKVTIVAIDQWGNRSKATTVNIIMDIKDTEVVKKIEKLDPFKIKANKLNNNKVALIIGIENYAKSPNATYANLDAKYFYEYVKNTFGVKTENIKLMINQEANLVDSLGALNKWLPGKVRKNQTDLIIYFAGHGLASSDGKELYLLPQDGDSDLLERTALSRTEIFQMIKKLSPKSVTMFLDTCYSGQTRDEESLLASARPLRIVADEQDTPDNFTIFSASQLDQISSGFKEAKHGIFSYYLMKGLEGMADSNKDKKITNGELLAYMDQNVAQKASELGRQQNPSLAGDPDKVLMSYR
ncbi:caspase family protein [Candidatus Pelagibacter sp.]|nr:caspase family protein [Candidatus Pelagibacter sp.]